MGIAECSRPAKLHRFPAPFKKFLKKIPKPTNQINTCLYNSKATGRHTIVIACSSKQMKNRRDQKAADARLVH
jgi:hypothetical protein